MTWFHPLGRWTARTLRSLTLTAAFVGTAGALAAQSTGASAGATRTPATLPKRIYTKTSEFKLPIQMDERTRGNLERVCLYVKSGSGDWVRQEAGPPTMPYFLYRVPQDGEYWFSLTTIDKTGKMTPADVSLEPPALRVLVDTEAPMLDVQQCSPEGELCLRCQVIDAHPDPSSVKAVAKLASGDRQLAVHPSQAGTFKVTGGPEILSATIQITASDLSGNTAKRDVRLRDLIASQVQGTSQQPAATAPTRVSAKVDMPPPSLLEFPPPPVLPMVPTSPNLATANPVMPNPVTPNPVTTNPLVPNTAASNTAAPNTAAPNTAAPNTAASAPADPTQNLQTPSRPETTTSAPPAPTLATANQDIVPVATNLRPQPETSSRSPAAALAAKKFINSPRASLDYRIDEVGPSGVGKVEVYLTTDQGETWKKAGDDADRRSPIEFDLTGEGSFGVRLAVTNGNGFGGTAPQRGDAPTCLIDVDTTAPFVQLRPIETIVTNGMLDIRWMATDKNFGAEPISLFYRTRAEGAWQVIARAVKNDGVYHWALPRDIASQFYVKVEATDLAGNAARVETPHPIILDTSEPRATVLGVTGMSVRP